MFLVLTSANLAIILIRCTDFQMIFLLSFVNAQKNARLRGKWQKIKILSTLASYLFIKTNIL